MDDNTAIRSAGSDSSSEDEEQEDSEDSSTIEDQLNKFRSQWQQELRKGQGQRKERSSGQGHTSESDRGKDLQDDVNANDFEKARRLFLMGVNAERSGMLYEAVKFYRQAIQLVPDIEFRIEEMRVNKARKRERLESSSSVGSTGGLTEEEEDADLSDLMLHFQKLRVRHDVQPVCEAEFAQQRTHISCLPVEVLMYIFKWVISDQLDMRSLEQLSMVCRGFYLCSRDEELWRLACLRTWGLNCEDIENHGTWRHLFLNRPHVKVHGCYISKTTYFRPGEPSMDSFYKPWHTVEYFRYARFFPDGNMMLYTSADDPHTVLPKLRSKHYRTPGLMYGYYRLVGNKVTGVLKRSNNADTTVSKYRRRMQETQQDNREHIFHVDFTLRDRGSKHRSTQLVWEYYSLHTEDGSINQEFDVSNENQYPNLYFSRVKSFTQSSNKPLE